MPLDVWMNGLLLLLTVGSFAYVFGLKRLPWWQGTSRLASWHWPWPSTSLSLCSFQSAS